MAIHESAYTHREEQFDELRNLLSTSYLQSRKPLNWRLAMAENWHYASRYLQPLEYFTSRAQLWQDDSVGLVSFLIRDDYMIYPQVDYQFRHLEAEMFEWAEGSWGGDKAEINTMVYDWDSQRQDLLAQRGYENKGAVEDVRIYDLSLDYPEASLPPRFRVTSVAETGDAQARIDLENSVWGATLDDAWFRGKSSAPSYSSHWDLMVLSPEGLPVAASLVWLYPQQQAAEIDPLGTIPEYRSRGLARALLLESFKRMAASKIRHAYIASYAQDPVVSHLYSSLQPFETYQGYQWVKRLS